MATQQQSAAEVDRSGSTTDFGAEEEQEGFTLVARLSDVTDLAYQPICIVRD